MTKLKNKDVLIISDSLHYLNSMKTPAWYQISKNLRAIKPIIQEITDSKDDIIKNLAAKDKDGNVMFQGEGEAKTVVFKDTEAADKKWSAMMNEEAKDISWYMFSAEKFGNIELDALAIEPLIDVCLVEE